MKVFFVNFREVLTKREQNSRDTLNELYEDWITFPASVQETDEAIQRCSDNNLFNIPQILGAIDGSHIPIKAPKHIRRAISTGSIFTL